MRPIRTFEVVPFLPPSLECLRDLAYNLRWTWDHETIGLFRRLDHDLWESTGHNPVLMLGTISQERLNATAADEGFMAHLQRIYATLAEYMKAEGTWYQKQFRTKQKDVIAYFSAEFCLTECLPIYSGGLGVLSGDHIKSSSELGLPLVGVGLAYQQGYFRQYLNPDGWQQERYPINDFYNMPIMQVCDNSGQPILISIDFLGRQVYAQIWKAQVGRVPLYLLDTNVVGNAAGDKEITAELYHGDPNVRIQQEMILGVGGMRALHALGIKPSVCHMNEGHSAFLGLERIKMFMDEHKVNFAQARELASAGQIFTTHTAVPAGIDKFSPELIDRYFSEYYHALKLDREEFLALGRANIYDENEAFSMAHLAIKLSAKTNAVSRLHAEVSRNLFKPVWPNIPQSEIPITSITNGIHTRSWISEEIADLYDRYLGPQWSEDIGDQNIWKRVEEIPDEELWRAHERRKARMVAFCRQRLKNQLAQRGAVPSELKEASEVLDSEIFTIGFARRVATYKRATLLLRDPKRLAKILTNKERPVQIIIAGKAHPEDTPAKELIRDLLHFARQEEVRKYFVFIEDYDANIARWLVQGVDVWLNTPRRFFEACGTSGMKVSFNGGINVSVLDGWWDEAYSVDAGWCIGHGETYTDTHYQDDVESNALYDLLEKEIIPLFYEGRKDGRSPAWISRMKSAMLEICPTYNINRMVREYALRAYFPAALKCTEFLEQAALKAKQLAAWKEKLRQSWHDVRIESVESSTSNKMQVGDDMCVKARVHLGNISSDEVAVQIFHGATDLHGDIHNSEIIPMVVNEKINDGTYLFSGTIRYFKSGKHGFTVRVLPHHNDQVAPFDTGFVLWAN